MLRELPSLSLNLYNDTPMNHPPSELDTWWLRAWPGGWAKSDLSQVPFLIRCRQGETQSHAPNQPNQIHTTPDTEPRRSRTKKNQGRPPVSGSTGNRYFFNLLQSNFPASHLALNCLNQTQ